MGGESGYITLNWIFGNLLGLSYRTWIVFMSFVDAFCVYQYLSHKSSSPLLGAMSIYVFTLTMYFSGYRRCMAMNVFMLAFIQLEKKHYKRALAMMLLAVTMHRSSLIMFIFLLLAKVKVTKSIIMRVIVFTFLLSLVAEPLARRFVPQVLALFDKSGYLTGTGTSDGWLYHKYGFSLLSVLYMMTLLCIYFFVEINVLQTPRNNLLCWIFLFFVAFSPIDSAMPIISAQISIYFRPSIYLFLTNILAERHENPHIRVILWCFAFMLICLSLHRGTIKMPLTYISAHYEYKTMFQTPTGF